MKPWAWILIGFAAFIIATTATVMILLAVKPGSDNNPAPTVADRACDLAANDATAIQIWEATGRVATGTEFAERLHHWFSTSCPSELDTPRYADYFAENGVNG